MMSEPLSSPLDRAVMLLIGEGYRKVAVELAAYVDTLRTDRDRARGDYATLFDRAHGSPCAQIAWQQERETLVEALKPFARMGDIIEGYKTKVAAVSLTQYGEHFRRARAAIARAEGRDAQPETKTEAK